MIKSISNFLDSIEEHLSNKRMIKGGNESTESTEPYKSYQSLLDNMYSYIAYVYANNEQNKKEYKKSIEELDKTGNDSYEKNDDEPRNDSYEKNDDEPRNDTYEKNDDESRRWTPLEELEPEINTTISVLLRKGDELE